MSRYSRFTTAQGSKGLPTVVPQAALADDDVGGAVEQGPILVEGFVCTRGMKHTKDMKYEARLSAVGQSEKKRIWSLTNFLALKPTSSLQ